MAQPECKKDDRKSLVDQLSELYERRESVRHENNSAIPWDREKFFYILREIDKDIEIIADRLRELERIARCICE